MTICPRDIKHFSHLSLLLVSHSPMIMFPRIHTGSRQWNLKLKLFRTITHGRLLVYQKESSPSDANRYTK
uniref:Putative ovule protein n=1 Tax=Solanum chacoense TaxID=4108 RepID=A0A0V0HF90_SOLCH